jgi:Reverse transcriptase (RNA-dependent DNA polymerase)
MGWPLTGKDLKSYPHFDSAFTIDQLTSLATDPDRVNQHPFLPFLLYYKSWQPFRKTIARPERKRRPIRFASRQDSAIFSFYRHVLAERYESELRRLGIESCPIAYRKIRALPKARGKCNIDFAAEAFAAVRTAGNCCVVTLDISSFFENIDHQKLKLLWCRLLGVKQLPGDHAAVFKATTKYSVVERDAAYERLGYFGDNLLPDGRVVRGFLRQWSEMPLQLCSSHDFRNKICGYDNERPNLVIKNENAFGIPQGAPISDLLANIYLIDFDKTLHQYVRTLNGTYFRYSDDIFILVPGGAADGQAAVDFTSSEIRNYGSKLEIKAKKTSIVAFSTSIEGILSATRIDKPRNTGGLEYLGFRFDGKNVYVREATMSKFHRSIRMAARNHARKLVRRFRGKDFAFLMKQFNLPVFEARFSRVANFERSTGRRSWTFRTYIKRCADIFGDPEGRFFQQIRGCRDFIRYAAERSLNQEIARTKRRNEIAN